MKAPPVDLRALVVALRADPEGARELAQVLAPYVFGIAYQNASRPAGTYSSRKGCGAPGLSDEENKRIASIIGRKRGRWFLYSAEELEAYERQKAAPPAASVTPVRAWSPGDGAQQAGLRVLGGRRT